ncbi:MAG: hypothetical protein MJA28_11680 [Gammaproteobacteria bacterium]|nr:hypothetical protein [Gammaproteobacteria bacterium]
MIQPLVDDYVIQKLMGRCCILCGLSTGAVAKILLFYTKLLIADESFRCTFQDVDTPTFMIMLMT